MTPPVALITGAAAGLGRALAQVLGTAGFDLVLVDNDPIIHEADDTTNDTTKDGELRCFGDVTDDDFLTHVVTSTMERHGRIDLLINNAGQVRYTPIDTEWDAAVRDFDDLWRVNSRAPFVLGRMVIPHMIEARTGHVINVSTDHVHTCGFPTVVDHADSPTCPWSTEPRRPLGGVAFDAYDATKWALNGLTQVWAAATRRYGIRVNNVCLGATDTPMIRRAMVELAGREPSEADAASWMNPSDVARLILHLHREGPTGRTGDNIGVWVGHPMRLPDPHPVLSTAPELR